MLKPIELKQGALLQVIQPPTNPRGQQSTCVTATPFRDGQLEVRTLGERLHVVLHRSTGESLHVADEWISPRIKFLDQKPIILEVTWKNGKICRKSINGQEAPIQSEEQYWTIGKALYAPDTLAEWGASRRISPSLFSSSGITELDLRHLRSTMSRLRLHTRNFQEEKGALFDALVCTRVLLGEGRGNNLLIRIADSLDLSLICYAGSNPTHKDRLDFIMRDGDVRISYPAAFSPTNPHCWPLKLRRHLEDPAIRQKSFSISHVKLISRIGGKAAAHADRDMGFLAEFLDPRARNIDLGVLTPMLVGYAELACAAGEWLIDLLDS